MSRDMVLLKNTELTMDSSPPTMRVVPSRPQVHVDAVVVVVVVIVVVVVVEVVVVVDVVVVVVVLVSSGQQGPVGCVGVMSKPNLACIKSYPLQISP